MTATQTTTTTIIKGPVVASAATTTKKVASMAAAKTTTNATNTVTIKLEGLGGLSQGSFFKVSAEKINLHKPPGTSLPNNNTDDKPQSLPTLGETFRKILTGEAFCYSPNLTWFLLAVGAWCFFPYDLEYASNDDSSSNKYERVWKIAKHRLIVNHGLALAYIGFWHYVLYFRNVCQRPYVPNRVYGTQKVWHNLFYTVLGILQWTVTEAIFIHLYQTKTIPFVHATQNSQTLWQTLILSVLIPPYRDVQFYFAHRLIHARPLYKYVHSLHHRNTDTEPFSGLAMHPIEHLYYYTCYGPLLVLPLLCNIPISPFLVFWMGTHCVISPAASRSGYEDPFSADLGHYLHHRYCECNYSAGINFDAWFGTYRETLPEATTDEAMPPRDPKSSLGWCPEHPDYEVGLAVLVAWVYYREQQNSTNPLWTACALTLGPTVWAIVLAIRSAPKFMSLPKACLTPFDKDSWASLVLHLGLGIFLGVLPATYLLLLLFRPTTHTGE